MRLTAILIALCLAGTGCGSQSSVKRSHWYRVGYARCAKAFAGNSFPYGRFGPGTMVLPSHHLKDFMAGCRTESVQEDIAYHSRYGWLEPYL